jgi:hypothetical protein
MEYDGKTLMKLLDQYRRRISLGIRPEAQCLDAFTFLSIAYGRQQCTQPDPRCLMKGDVLRGNYCKERSKGPVNTKCAVMLL